MNPEWLNIESAVERSQFERVIGFPRDDDDLDDHTDDPLEQRDRDWEAAKRDAVTRRRGK